MGTPDFAATILAGLIDAGHRIRAVYTQPPRPAGRGHRLQPSPVQALAEQHGIAVRVPTSLREPEAQAEFAATPADIAVVAAYGLILPAAILEAPRHGCLNVHASLLPRWRGAAPIQRALLAGDSETGITIMQMEEGLDTGPILLQQAIPIAPKMTSGELSDAPRRAWRRADPRRARRRRAWDAGCPAPAERGCHLRGKAAPRGGAARLAPPRDRARTAGARLRSVAGRLFLRPRRAHPRAAGRGRRSAQPRRRRARCSTTVCRSPAARACCAPRDCSGRAAARSTRRRFCAGLPSRPGPSCRAPLQADDRILRRRPRRLAAAGERAVGAGGARNRDPAASAARA